MKKISKIKKTFFIITIFVIFCININNIVIAASHLYDTDALNRLTTSADSSYKPSINIDQDSKNMINKILGVITIVGVVIGVVCIAMIGFYYVLGSADEKAINKQQLIIFTIGAILLVFGSTIVKVIYNQFGK